MGSVVGCAATGRTAASLGCAGTGSVTVAGGATTGVDAAGGSGVLPFLSEPLPFASPPPFESPLFAGESASLETIGKELGLTRERVRQLESEALMRLQLELGDELASAA